MLSQVNKGKMDISLSGTVTEIMELRHHAKDYSRQRKVNDGKQIGV
jgi:hypothetical protein